MTLGYGIVGARLNDFIFSFLRFSLFFVHCPVFDNY